MTHRGTDGRWVHECDFCCDIGYVPMLDYDGYSFAFACKCIAGDKNSNLARWEGGRYQTHKGKTYKLNDLAAQILPEVRNAPR